MVNMRPSGMCESTWMLLLPWPPGLKLASGGKAWACAKAGAATRSTTSPPNVVDFIIQEPPKRRTQGDRVGSQLGDSSGPADWQANRSREAGVTPAPHSRRRGSAHLARLGCPLRAVIPVLDRRDIGQAPLVPVPAVEPVHLEGPEPGGEDTDHDHPVGVAEIGRSHV